MKLILNNGYGFFFLIFFILTHNQKIPAQESIKLRPPNPYGEWKSMGPHGMPNVVSRSNTYGVGQANRITFDPFYDGESNKTLYACSSFGGLWRSHDDGMSWYNVNTDFLPTTSVADMCVNPFNSNELFLTTGFADGDYYAVRSPNWAHTNPIYTTGVYRSRNYGHSWEDISSGFIESLVDNGIPRRMVINPMNPDQLFIATSHGIFRTNSATRDDVIWKNVFKGLTPNDHDFRSVEFKPDDSNVIYAAGRDIFRSPDGGDTWESMTGEHTGLDLTSLPNDFKIDRINLAVTPADPNRLYGYIMGDQTQRDRQYKGAYIVLFENDRWRVIDNTWSAGLTYFSVQWIALAVSPVDADVVYYGNSRVIGTEKLDSVPFGLRSPYCGNGFHADVHDLVFQPNVENPKLFCANHGGISVKTLPNPNIKGWEYRNEGFSTTLIWSFDDSPYDENMAIIATQDNGTMVYYDTLGYKWHFIGGGDGYSARMDDQNPGIAYFSTGDKSLNLFNFNTFKQEIQTGFLPMDAVRQNRAIITVKTFPLLNHPQTGKAWFGFTEIYTKEITNPQFGIDRNEVWTRQSDIHRTEPRGWKRQVHEIAICTSAPEVIYAVTGGQQNTPGSDWQLQSGLYKSVTGGINGKDPDETAFQPLEYPGLNYDDDTLAIITGIAVNPLDHNHVWITYTGIPGQYRIWESLDGGKSWINTDPEGIFIRNPVNAIAFLEGSDDRLFIGTDKGLYSKNRFSDWEKITDFPNVRVTEIKINNPLNRIRVATFGRGLWEGPIIN